MREYDEISDWFAANRSAEVGLPDIADFVRFLPPGSKVLELAHPSCLLTLEEYEEACVR